MLTAERLIFLQNFIPAIAGTGGVNTFNKENII